MAESVIQVTEGSGKKIHTFNRTIGANSVEDEVTINGEQYLSSYAIQISPSTATANSHLLEIMAGASLRVRIRRIEIYQSTLCTTAALMGMEVRRLTTAGTGGTAIGLSTMDPGDGAAGATAMQLATVKGTEPAGLVLWAGSMYMMQTAGASSILPNPLIIDLDRAHLKPMIIAAGITSGLAIKNTTAIAAGTVTITVWLDESNF